MESMEAIARLEAESALLKEHEAEYRRLSAARETPAGIRKAARARMR